MFELIDDLPKEARWPFPSATAPTPPTDLFVGVRFDGETDVIGFHTHIDCQNFCKAHPEYQYMKTGLYSLKEAMEVVGDDEQAIDKFINSVDLPQA